MWPRSLLFVRPASWSVLVAWVISVGGCITPVGSADRGSGASGPLAELKGETLGFVSPLPTRPRFKNDSGFPLVAPVPSGVLEAATGVSLQAAMTGGWRKRRALARLKDIVDPSPSLRGPLTSLLAHRFGTRFVVARAGDYTSAVGGRRSGSVPPLSLAIVSIGYGLTDLENDPEDVGAYYNADIVVTNWSALSPQEIVVKKCRLESKWSISVKELEGPGASKWLQARVNHLANRCLRLFEEEVCRVENPHLKPDQCATLPEERDEVDEEGG